MLAAVIVGFASPVLPIVVESAHAAGDVWNARLAIEVNDDGEFSIGAQPNPATGELGPGSWSITFDWPDSITSATTVRLNGVNEYVDDLPIISAPTAVDLSTNRAVFLDGAVQVTQVLQIVPNVQTGQADVAQISYVLANTSSTTQTVGLRIMLDTDINGNDGAPFRVPGSAPITTERTYVGAAIPAAFDVFADVTDTNHVSSVQPKVGSNPPDVFQIARWPGIVGTAWNYVTSTSRSITSDSAYAVTWNERQLAPGESISYTTAIGQGQLSADTTPPLSVGLSGPARVKFVNGVYANNPFNFVGTIRNSSSVTATGVVVSLALPPQLALSNAVATPLSFSLGTLSPGAERQVSWNVAATLQQFDTTVQYSMAVTSTNAGTKNLNRALVLSGVPGVFVPMNPARLVDSRDGVGVRIGPMGQGETLNLQAAGIAGVPANARTVVLNLTGIAPSVDTFLTMWPSGEARPGTSNHNLAAGEIAANLAIIKVGAGGQVAVFNASGSINVAIDVMGYFLDPASGAGVRQQGLSPARLVDTREGKGAPLAQIAQGGVLEFTAVGVGGVPADATAVILNVTGAGPVGAGGFLTVWPSGEARPLASNLNLNAEQVRPNLVIAKVGAGGRVSVFNQAGPIHLVVDVFGYFSPSAGSGQVGIQPQRALDTRDGTGQNGIPRPLGEGQSITFRASGLGAVPDYASTVVLNVVAVQPLLPSFLTFYPTGELRPNSSNLNMLPGQVIANHVIVKVGVGGSITIFNPAGTTNVVVDVMGYFA